MERLDLIFEAKDGTPKLGGAVDEIGVAAVDFAARPSEEVVATLCQRDDILQAKIQWRSTRSSIGT
jgi:hypothetical protein